MPASKRTCIHMCRSRAIESARSRARAARARVRARPWPRWPRRRGSAGPPRRRGQQGRSAGRAHATAVLRRRAGHARRAACRAMSVLALDTSVVVAALLGAHEHHDGDRDLFRARAAAPQGWTGVGHVGATSPCRRRTPAVRPAPPAARTGRAPRTRARTTPGSRARSAPRRVRRPPWWRRRAPRRCRRAGSGRSPRRPPP